MIESLIELVNSYGWSTILIFIILFGLFIGFKYMTKKLEADVESVGDKIATILTKNTSEQNKVLVGTINKQNEKILNYILDSKEKEITLHADKLHGRIISTEEINLRLRDIGHKFKADRVSILEFHNTSQNLIGIPFAKYSCNFEWIKKGNISLQAKCQSLPFSMISLIVKDIMNSDGTYKQYKDIEYFADINSGLYTVLKEVNCHSLIYNAIYDNKNNIIGLLALEYKGQFSDDLNMDELRIDTESITILLNLIHKEKECE